MELVEHHRLALLGGERREGRLDLPPRGGSPLPPEKPGMKPAVLKLPVNRLGGSATPVVEPLAGPYPE